MRPVVYGVNDNQNGYSAKECFWIKDTHGQTKPCREHHLFLQVLEVKERVNLTCKMQAEDVADGLVHPLEIESWHADAPPWVIQSIFRQVKKMMKDRYIPKFLLTVIEKYVE